ncbi:MAG: hypothetical protein ACKN82_19670, partial [Pirellula sp.]
MTSRIGNGLFGQFQERTYREDCLMMKQTNSLLRGQMAIEFIAMALILNNGSITVGRTQEQVKLEWKFAKGQTTYYTNEQEMEIRDTVQGKVFTSSIGTSFKYKWT